MTFTLKINGSEIAAQALHVSLGSLELQNLREDSFSLQWTRRSASEPCPFAHNDVVEIFADGRRLFVGRARIGPISSTGAPIRIVGPWSHLEEQFYHVSLTPGFINDPDGLVIGDTYDVTYPAGSSLWNGTGYTTIGSSHTITWTLGTRSFYSGYPSTSGTSDINLGWTARCWLFRPGGSLGQIYTTIQDEFERLKTFVTNTQSSTVFTEGITELGDVLAPRVRTVQDAHVAECLRQIFAAKPDAALWWDYTGSAAPILNARVASLESALELTVGQQVLSDYRLKKMHELVPDGVVLRWENQANTSTGLGSPKIVDVYPGMEVAYGDATITHGSTSVTLAGGTGNLEVGMLVIGAWIGPGATISSISSGGFVMSQPANRGSSLETSITVSRLIFRSTAALPSYQPGVLLHTITDDIEPVPGLAKGIYESLSTLRAQGTLTVLDRTYSLGLRPGAVITLTGDAELEDVQLWCQSVTWDPGTGLAQVTVGYPAQLDLRTRADLRGWLRVTFNGPLVRMSWVVPPP